ncbi:MAG: agmatine deiminase family protein [Deltaproteobacteria bacterium]|nr:agmatine deiminase family protein [Deltaproteobacteria bacterium]
MVPNNSVVLPAEWYKQSAVQLTWPHAKTDWAPYLEEANECFVNIAEEIIKREKLLIVTPEPDKVRSLLAHCPQDNIIYAKLPTNDTWARDHAGITVLEHGNPVVLDFRFNGWGNKFAAELDNQINKGISNLHLFSADISLRSKKDFVLEGGSVESDGCGTLLTTNHCLMAPNRNDRMSKADIENYLLKTFGLNRVLWLNYGHLEGDDTDGHIDTLVRFCNAKTLAYVKCSDTSDSHYPELQKMEAALTEFRTAAGKPYQLVPLPHAEAIWENGERLPATYANFLIINGAVLMPIYGIKEDKIAVAAIKTAFPNREVVEINCRVLIKQHGSLHCVTMQYPEGVFNG